MEQLWDTSTALVTVITVAAELAATYPRVFISGGAWRINPSHHGFV